MGWTFEDYYEESGDKGSVSYAGIKVTTDLLDPDDSPVSFVISSGFELTDKMIATKLAGLTSITLATNISTIRDLLDKIEGRIK